MEERYLSESLFTYHVNIFFLGISSNRAKAKIFIDLCDYSMSTEHSMFVLAYLEAIWILHSLLLSGLKKEL